MRKIGLWSGCRDCRVAEAFDLRHGSPAENDMVLNPYTTDSAGLKNDTGKKIPPQSSQLSPRKAMIDILTFMLVHQI